MDIVNSMRDLHFLKLIRNTKLAVFTPMDISRLIRSTTDYVYTYMNRLVMRELIVRIEQGKYTLPDTPIESVATNLLYPSYISFLSGFYYHKRTTQIPRVITVVSARSKRTIAYQGYNIRFIKFPPEKVFGYERNKNSNIWYLASVEKCIADSLYLPKNCSMVDTFMALKQGVDEETLINYGLKMNSIVTLKRMGFLLDKVGIDVYDVLKPYLNSKDDPLDPQLPKNGKKDKKWKLIINTEVENAH